MHRPALLVALVLACGHRSTPTQGGTATTSETTSSVAESSPTGRTRTPSANVITTWPKIETKAPALTGKPAQAGRPKGDRSLALPDWDVRWVRIQAPTDVREGEVFGNVAKIEMAVADKPGVLRIEAADGRVVEMQVSGPGQLALTVGDAVAAKWRTSHIQIHTVHDVAVLDADGHVVYASSGTGDATFAPGWHVEVDGVAERGTPHMRGGARRESRWLLLANGDAAAFVQQSESARRLATPDGDFAVSGSATTWSEGMRPPDSSTYETFGLVRLR